MQVEFRHYHGAEDYPHISDFLITHHQPGNGDGNWIEPVWEYLIRHCLDRSERQTQL